MNEEVDAALDAVLKAGGSALRHYTMQKSLDDMREAMRRIMIESYIAGGNAAHDAMKSAYSGKQPLQQQTK